MSSSTQTQGVTFPQSDWEKYALCYDSLLHLRPYTEMLSKVAHSLLFEGPETILDASCGTGNFEQALLDAQETKSFEVIGVDTSLEMLARAQQKFETLNNLSFYEANLNIRLPFKDKAFSSVVSINTLYAVADPKKTLEEFYRVLKPGGKLFLVTPKSGYENGFILKEHCKSDCSDEFWKDCHSSAEREELLIRTAISDESVIKNMLSVAKHNRNIVSNNPFHFFHKRELALLLKKVSFVVSSVSSIYANQSVFTIAQKG